MNKEQFNDFFLRLVTLCLAEYLKDNKLDNVRTNNEPLVNALDTHRNELVSALLHDKNVNLFRNMTKVIFDTVQLPQERL